MPDDLLDAYSLSLRGAPELQAMPWAIGAVAATPAPLRTTVARTVGHTANMYGAQKTADDLRQQHGKHWWDTAFDWLTGRSAANVGKRAAPTVKKVAATTGAAVDVYRHPEQHDLAAPVRGAFDHREQIAESTLPKLEQASAASSGGALLNTAQAAPLHEVTHQYRALRDIYDRHGVAAGLGETFAVLGGAAAGGYLAGGSGATLGAELTAGLSERSLFQDSWDRTANGEAYRDAAGQVVSPGRDLARVVQAATGYELRKGTLPYNALSGIGDGLFTLTADPLANTAGLAHGFNATEEAAGGLLGQWRGDTVLRSPADIDDLLVRRARTTKALFHDLSIKTANEISQSYPDFQSLARDLGAAKSEEEVANVFRDALQQPEIIGHALPTRIRGKAAVLGDSAPISDDPIGRLARFQRRVQTKLPLTLNRIGLDFSHARIDPSVDTNFEVMRAALKMTTASDRVIDGVMERIINTDDIGLRRTVFRNAMRDSVLAMAPKDADPALVRKLEQALGDEMGGTGGMEGAHYGYDAFGQNRSALRTEDGSGTAALVSGQRGDVVLPDYTGMVRSIREVEGGAKALFGRVDDFAFQRIIKPFKSLALLSGGFALRVGTAELIPAVLRNGVYDTIRASATAKAAQWGERLSDEELGSLRAATIKLLRSPTGVLTNADDVDLATRLVQTNGGSVVAPAVRAGDFTANNEMGAREANRINLYRASAEAPQQIRETGKFQKFASGVEDFPLYWQRAFREFANDTGIQEASAAYRKAYADAARERVPLGREGGFTEVVSREAGSQPPRELTAATPAVDAAGTDVAPVEAAAQPTATATRKNDELVKIATREAIKADMDYLTNRMDPRERSDFMRSSVSAHDGMDPIQSWATERVEVMKGLTHAAPMPANEFVPTPHDHLLEAMSQGATPGIEVFEAIPEHEQPLAVKGRVTAPVPNDNLITRIANLGWRKVIDPTINTLGREHQYFLSVKKFYANYQPMIDAGVIDEDTALMHAQIKAVQDVARFVHNPAERTQFAQLMRNVAPFYFAQEQSYRRLGRLLSTDPAAFRRFQIMQMRFIDFSHKQSDESGVPYVVMPGLGWLDEGAVKLASGLGLPLSPSVPNQVLGNVDSFQTVFPFSEGTTTLDAVRPSWSVLVTLPVRLIEDRFPETRKYGDQAIGGAANAGSTVEAIIPNTALRNLFKTGETLIAPERMASSVAATIQALQYKQNIAAAKWVAAGHELHTGAPDSPFAKGEPHFVPTAWQLQNDSTINKDFFERVRNQSRIGAIFKALLSTGLPASPTVSVDDYGLKAKYRTYIDKYGLVEGPQRFLDENPNATPYTVFNSDFKKGVPIGPYRASQDFYDKHKGVFDKYPAAAGYLIPQPKDAKYDPAVYQEQVALGLREIKAPDQLVHDFYVNEGYADYQTNKAAHDAYVVAHAADQAAIDVENQNWHDWVHNVAAKVNPVWWDYFTASDRTNRRDEELAQLRIMVKDTSVPNTAMKRGIRGLITDLDTQLTILNNGHLDQWSAADRQAAADRWLSYLASVRTQHPELSTVINRLFSHFGAK